MADISWEQDFLSDEWEIRIGGELKYTVRPGVLDIIKGREVSGWVCKDAEGNTVGTAKTQDQAMAFAVADLKSAQGGRL